MGAAGSHWEAYEEHMPSSDLPSYLPSAPCVLPRCLQYCWFFVITFAFCWILIIFGR